MAAKRKRKKEKKLITASSATSKSVGKPSGSGLDNRLDRIEKQLRQMQVGQDVLTEFDTRTESIVERKVYEIKAISYVTLIISAVLLALVLGMVLNALGIKIL